MTRPDPVLEKWLQEQERKLLRAQTDMVRIQQQPRRGSAGEALIQNASSDAYGIHRDCESLCPNWSVFKLTIAGLEDIEAVDPGCTPNTLNLSELNGEWMFQGVDTNGSQPTVCTWVPPGFDVYAYSGSFCSGPEITEMFVRYQASLGTVVFTIARAMIGAGCDYQFKWSINDTSVNCNGVNTLSAVNPTGTGSPLDSLGCTGNSDMQIAGTSTPWDHSMATITIENLY